MIHVALLRGINVGGNNTVPMAELRRLCTDLGFTNATTYINSGNVVFGATEPASSAMGLRIEDAIEAHFGFRCRVLVRSGDDIAAIAAAIPADWTNGPDMTANVGYLLDGVDPAEVVARLAPTAGIDTVHQAAGAILWMVARRDATRNGLHRIIGTEYYQQVTIRNVNTARRLAAMVTAVAG